MYKGLLVYTPIGAEHERVPYKPNDKGILSTKKKVTKPVIITRTITIIIMRVNVRTKCWLGGLSSWWWTRPPAFEIMGCYPHEKMTERSHFLSKQHTVKRGIHPPLATFFKQGKCSTQNKNGRNAYNEHMNLTRIKEGTIQQHFIVPMLCKYLILWFAYN
jgi:hypothetical protein